MRGANKVAIELGKTRRQGFPVAATDIGDVFQYRLFVFDFRRRDSRNRILRRCGGHFPQLIDKFLPGRVVLKHVGKCAVSGFFFSASGSGGAFCWVAVAPVVTPGMVTASDGALNRVNSSNRIHGTASSDKNIVQNDKYRARGAEGSFWEQSGIKSRACPALCMAIRRRVAGTPGGAG